MPIIALIFLFCGGAYGLNWTELTPSEGPTPPVRMRAAGVYDPVGHRLIVIGGRTSGRELNDVWAFDLENNVWTELTPSGGEAPVPRSTHNAVYDAAHHRVIVWSGRDGNILQNDVWAFSLVSPAWFAYEPSGTAPNIRYGTAAVFDPVAGELVTFAGFTDEGRFEDSWRFDLDSVAWTDISPQEGNPGKRCLHTASYDSRDHRMLVYGGQRGSSALNDIWALDLSRDLWSELTPEVSPPGRFFASSASDTRDHRLLIFGGNRGSDDKVNEVWSLDLEERSWELLEAEGMPPAARDGAVMIYVEAERRLIVFGGAAPVGLFNDVWALEGLEPPIPTAIEERAARPNSFVLHQNAPNPFNPSTVVSYELGQEGWVELEIFDLLGRKVRTLVDERRGSGSHVAAWDGRDDRGAQVATGAYLYRLRAGGFVASRKLLLIR